MPLLLDTGVLYALADADDRWHAASRELLASARELLLTPVTVLPEVTYLLRSRLGRGAEASFVRSIADGELSVEPIELPDLQRCYELLERYQDLGFVDNSVVAVAERLRLPAIATTDRRHFAQVRPRHRRAFELLP